LLDADANVLIRPFLKPERVPWARIFAGAAGAAGAATAAGAGTVGRPLALGLCNLEIFEIQSIYNSF
jgi:hypothetical protein